MSSDSPSHFVSFPTSESAPVSPLPVPHLPFRRISLPTTPSPALAAHRQSVASLASFDSLPEEPAIVHQHRRAKRRSLNPAAARSHRRTQADDDRQAKRSKIVSEFYATEKTYLDGLDLVYNHFLTPILRSLDTSKPLLARNEITALFSNFIDIWNFHHTFFVALPRHFRLPTSIPHHNVPLSSVLLAHFPYLSLYAPFITAFPTALAFLASVSQPSTPNPAFAAFLRAQEAHPVCAHLRLADYLLTPVQRCPRYLLLLKDLLGSTDPDDPEWEKLQETRVLVEKITNSLNTSLAAHAQTLALISLQRNTRDLPPVLIPLVVPGRRLIKRGTLIRSGSEGEGAVRKPFEFLLLSDYLLWLERGESGIGILVHDAGGQSPRKRRVSMNALDRNDDDDKWWCRGHMSLVDTEVVLVADRPSGGGSGGGSEERIEVLSPEGSFALHNHSSPSSLEDSNSLSSWVDSIRTTRAARLSALAMSNPDSTLSASTSGVHLRRALRAFASESDDTGYEQKFEETGDGSVSSPGNSQAGPPPIETRRFQPRRAQLDNFLPPIWIPDARTDTCMRCGRPFGFVLDLRLGDVFGWGFGKGNTTGVEAKQKSDIDVDGSDRSQVGKRAGGGAWRRKHHCRLCGRVVCAACSGKTFYTAQDDGDSLPAKKRQKPKPSRACEECWEAAFPLIVPSPPGLEPLSLPLPAIQPSSSKTPSDRSSTPQADEDPDIPPWLSIPSRQVASKDVSEALMAMDFSPVTGVQSRSPSRAALSTSPSRIALNNSPSRKSRLSTSPTKASSPLRDTYTQTHEVPGSNTSSPSRRVIHLPRISSGDSDAKQSSPSPTALHARDLSSGSVNRETRRDDHHEYTRPIRVRPSPTRPRSYHDILEDFTLHERGLSIPSSISSAPPGAGLGSVREGEDEAEDKGDADDDEEDGEGEGEIVIEIRPRDRLGEGHSRSLAASADGNSQDVELPGAQQGPADEDVPPREDTARRRKRFSMPAVALQTAPVFARGRQDAGGSSAEKRRSAVMHGGERDKGKKERQGEKDGSAVGLLMEVLRGKVKYPGRSS